MLDERTKERKKTLGINLSYQGLGELVHIDVVFGWLEEGGYMKVGG